MAHLKIQVGMKRIVKGMAMAKNSGKTDTKIVTPRAKLPCADRRVLIVDDEKTICDLFLQIDLV